MGSSGIIFDIKRYAVHDGPGIRTTVFLKGCPMSCWWCHNPESQKLEPEIIHKKVAFNDSTPIAVKEVIGKKATVEEVLAEVMQDRVFYEESGGGVTFSGGEPLYQPKFLHALLVECKAREIHTAIDTAGCASQKVFKQILPYTDLFLYDLKLLDNERHQRYTGYSNEQILDNLKFLSTMKKAIIVRIPVIPTVNDSPEEMTKIGQFLEKLNISQVELLPYHKIGEEKYSKLQKINRMTKISPPTKDDLQRIKELLEQYNLRVAIEV